METFNLNTNFNKVLQGVASLGSEQPEENKAASAGLPKTRIRYSGATRRRYNKEKARAEKAISPSPTNTPTPPGGEGGAAVGTQKRARPVHQTPSPTEYRPGKRPKVTDQGSYARTTKGMIRMAFVPEGYPEKKLGSSEGGEIRRLVRKHILELPEDGLAPTFTGTWERDGAVIFNCANQQTVDWLKSLSTVIKIGGTALHVLPAGELPKRHRVVVHVEESDLAVEEAIKLLDRQNTGLGAREWVVVRGSESRDAKSAHFAALIGDRSLEVLKTCGFKPFCGLGRATVRLLDKERKEGVTAGASGSA
ncbi:hypothetical protein ALC62_12263 [Cyphomyrmex costatus]|uniref:DUF4780 domain-containing protein n=1 Tax=Cyphomyrmex costatus TaxID=456900 RepID=A0A151IBN4_9HYME|nr:hypothetical protein ALC62_12263 [Cyphomyrmex costatus]